MAKSKALWQYSFRNVAATLNGRLVIGLWEGDDAVTIERRSDVSTPLVGVDGQAIASYSADESVLVTFRLMPTSPSHRWLTGRLRRIMSGRFDPFSVSVRNTGGGGVDGVGEGGNSSDCTIVTAPGASFGANAVSRDWVLFCQAWEWNEIRNT